MPSALAPTLPLNAPSNPCKVAFASGEPSFKSLVMGEAGDVLPHGSRFLPHLVSHIDHAADHGCTDEQDKNQRDANQLREDGAALRRLARNTSRHGRRKRTRRRLRPLLTRSWRGRGLRPALIRRGSRGRRRKGDGREGPLLSRSLLSWSARPQSGRVCCFICCRHIRWCDRAPALAWRWVTCPRLRLRHVHWRKRRGWLRHLGSNRGSDGRPLVVRHRRNDWLARRGAVHGGELCRLRRGRRWAPGAASSRPRLRRTGRNVLLPAMAFRNVYRTGS